MATSTRSSHIGLLLVALVSAAFSETARAEGWKFWQKSDDQVDAVPYTTTSSLMPSLPKFSVTKAASGMWKTTTSVTRKAARTTTDVVTLKPLRSTKKTPSQFRLGAHPARKPAEPKSSWFGSLFSKSSE